MANFQSMLSIFAVAILLCLKGTNCQNKESQKRLYASLSVLRRVTKELGQFYPERINFTASNIPTTNNFLDAVKSLAALLKNEHTLEEKTSKDVLEIVKNNSCTMVKLLMEDGSFNCTETEVDSLINQVILRRTSSDIQNMFRRVCLSCQANRTAEIEWVRNRIPCTGNGAITRAYLADNNFEEVRFCTTASISTTMASA